MGLLCPQKERKEGGEDGEPQPRKITSSRRCEISRSGPGANRSDSAGSRSNPKMAESPGVPSVPALTPEVTGNAVSAAWSAPTGPSVGPRRSAPPPRRGRAPGPSKGPAAPVARLRAPAAPERPGAVPGRSPRRARPSPGPQTYFQGEFFLGPLVEDLQNFPVDAQPQDLGGDLVVVDDGVLLDLQA